MLNQTPATSSAAQRIFELIPGRDGAKLRLLFHAGQTKAWDSLKRFIFVIAGTQGGKTSFGPWWMWREIGACGAGDYLAVCPTFDLFKLKMLPEIRQVFEDILDIGRYWPSDRIMEIKDPETGEFWANKSDDLMYARIILRSAVSSGGLESTTAKAAWLDECGQPDFTLDAWQAVLRRLSLSRGRALGTTTPYDIGWLKKVIVNKWREGDPDIDVIRFASVVNPAFPIEEYETAKKYLPPWKFKMMYRGYFTHPAGMIYEDFVDDYRENGGHKVKPFDIPKDWPRYVGIDPSGIHHSSVWLARDPAENVFYLYRETLEGGKATQDHAKRFLDLETADDINVRTWWVGAKSETQQRLDYRKHGLSPVREPLVTDVESGISQIISLWRTNRLFVFDDCPRVLNEINDYSRVVDSMGNPTIEIADKKLFHLADALRYASGSTRKMGSLLG